MQKNLMPVEVQLVAMIASGKEVYLTEEGRQRILAAFPDTEEEGAAVNE